MAVSCSIYQGMIYDFVNQDDLRSERGVFMIRSGVCLLEHGYEKLLSRPLTIKSRL